MFLGTNAALRGCQEYFNRCAAAGSPIGATQTPTAYDNAASFNGTSQFLSVASNSSLTVTGSSFTFAFWANTPNTSNAMVISKTSGGDTREFQISLITGGIVEFRLLPDGTFANSRFVQTPSSSFTANTWNFFVCRYDSSAATIGVSVNGGAFTSVGSIPAITQTNTNPLNFGVFLNTASGLNYTGQLASVGFWKRALTASEVTQLFNSGAGRTYASLDSGLRTNLVSWWALNGNSSAVSLTDSHTGGNNLSNTGSVTAPNIGPVVTALSDPRQLIVDFAQGIDQLGLWNSMVCWPLRASQNAQTGTTAFSLGGLGQFDGTLVGSPSRVANGINTSPSGSVVNFGAVLNSLVLNDFHSYINVFQKASSVVSGNIWDAYGSVVVGSNTRRQQLQILSATQLRQTHSGYGGAAIQTINSNFNSSLGYLRTTQAGPTNFGFDSGLALNGGAYATDSVVNSPTAFGDFNSIQTSTGIDVTHSFMAVFPKTFVSNSAQIYSLYKQTLGLGLGLP